MSAPGIICRTLQTDKSHYRTSLIATCPVSAAFIVHLMPVGALGCNMSYWGRAYETMHSFLVACYFANFFSPYRGPANHPSNANRCDILVAAPEMDRRR
jgi:hypothetical protein